MRRVKLSLVFAGLLLCGKAFGQQPKESDYVVITYTTQMDWIFPIGSKATTLSRVEINEAEQLLRQCIDKYNAEHRKLYQEAKKADPDVRERDYVIDIAVGKRQYVGALDPAGEKVVWINYRCSAVDEDVLDWRKSIVLADDGGNCFFQVKINLTKKQYSGFNVNGN